MIRIGLTGSIAMGKTSTAARFKKLGVPVYDADAAAHRVYEPGGAAVAAVKAIAPEAVVDGGVDRGALKKRTLEQPGFLKKLEEIVHPIIAKDRKAFERQARAAGSKLAVYDVPLLYETGMDAAMDVVVVVSAPESVQRERALARPGMTQEMLNAILARQTPDSEKRARADFIVDTSRGHDDAAAQVDAIVAELLSRLRTQAPAEEGPHAS